MTNTIETTGATGPSYPATVAGDYTVTVSNSAGAVLSNNAAVTVLAQPVPSFTVGVTSGNAPLSVPLVNTRCTPIPN